MSDLIESAAALAVPGGGIAARLVKYGLWVVGGLLAIGAAVALIWWLFFSNGAAKQKSEIVGAQGRGAISAAGAKSGVDAIRITVDNSKAAAGIDAAVRSAIDEIRKAKGSEVAVDPAVDAAGRRAICLRPSAAGIPECERLLGTGP